MKLKKIPEAICVNCNEPIGEGSFEGNWSIELVNRKVNGAKMEVRATDLCLVCAKKLVEEFIVDVHKMTVGEMTLEEYVEKHKK